MRSPFPGMDPYLERHWSDVSTSLLVYACDHIQEQLPDDLVARVTSEDDLPRKHRILIQTARSGIPVVVTAIEVLRPSDKIGAGRTAYQESQREHLTKSVNLVEIDLVRSGAFTLAVPWKDVEDVFRATSYVCVRRAVKPHEAEIYRTALCDSLPTIPIPLRATDRDVTLNLQTFIDRCYQKGRYGSAIDYREDPHPPLGPADSRWVDELLRSAGLRR